jgi:hypothetical protein
MVDSRVMVPRFLLPGAVYVAREQTKTDQARSGGLWNGQDIGDGREKLVVLLGFSIVGVVGACEAAQIHAHERAHAVEFPFTRPILCGGNHMTHAMCDRIPQPCEHIGRFARWRAEEEPPGLAGKVLRDGDLMVGRRMIGNAPLMCPAVRRNAFQQMALDWGERQQTREDGDRRLALRGRNAIDELDGLNDVCCASGRL